MSTWSVVNSSTPTTLDRRAFPDSLLNYLAVSMLVSIVAAGIVWWCEHKYEYIPKRWGVVVPGKIFRSGQLTPQMLGKTLTQHGITTIIDLQLKVIEQDAAGLGFPSGDSFRARPAPPLREFDGSGSPSRNVPATRADQHDPIPEERRGCLVNRQDGKEVQIG